MFNLFARAEVDEFRTRISGISSKMDGPIDPNISGIVQTFRMGTYFDRHKDALITPTLPEDRSIILLPPSLAFLEPLTKAPWWLHLVTWVPFVVWQWLGRMSCPCSFANMCVFLVSFAMGWPLLEYGMHRFLFHMPVAWAKGNGYVNVARFLMHTVHHAHPRDRLRLVTPLPMSLVIAAVVFPIPWLLLRSADEVRAVMCGLIMGFVLYDYVHYFLHFGDPNSLPEPWCTWSRQLKRAHANHHYAPHGTGQSFGVSHTLWDELLGTSGIGLDVAATWDGQTAPSPDMTTVNNKMDKVD